MILLQTCDTPLCTTVDSTQQDKFPYKMQLYFIYELKIIQNYILRTSDTQLLLTVGNKHLY